ncbi:hypothetical protein BaRGS_00009323 [Batillaria attramentaria]|uniref:Uncharacterized protein n=1 Tax=Batillaria attramentaria TaxID=370345 RepID=A0ABD0LJK5_9CAEN
MSSSTYFPASALTPQLLPLSPESMSWTAFKQIGFTRKGVSWSIRKTHSTNRILVLKQPRAQQFHLPGCHSVLFRFELLRSPSTWGEQGHLSVKSGSHGLLKSTV